MFSVSRGTATVRPPTHIPFHIRHHVHVVLRSTCQECKEVGDVDDNRGEGGDRSVRRVARGNEGDRVCRSRGPVVKGKI